MTEYDTTPVEHKIDPEKYRGMSLHEARLAEEEDRRRAINEDPRTIAALQAVEERQAAERAEERRQENEARKQRELDAKAAWAEEYDRRLQLWVASGGAESDFDAAWPDLKHQILMERVSGDEERREREAFSGFRL